MAVSPDSFLSIWKRTTKSVLNTFVLILDRNLSSSEPNLRRTIADWQRFFNRPLRWPPPDLSKRWKLVSNTILLRTTLTRAMKPHDKIFFIWGGAKLRRAKLPVTSTPSLVTLWCPDLRRGNTFLRLAFSQENEKLPPLSFPAIYPIPSLL